MKKVVFLTNIPSPYQIDFYEALNDLGQIDLSVFFCAATEVDRSFSAPEKFRFDGEILPGRRLHLFPKDGHRVPQLPVALASKMPIDLLVISGSYFMPAAVRARGWAGKNSVKWAYWGENPAKKGRTGVKSYLRSAYLRRFLHGANCIFGVGQAATDEYRKVSAGSTTFSLPYAPNLDSLIHPTRDVTAKAQTLRQDWGLENPVVMLFSGSLTHRKAPDLLLQAFQELAGQHQNLCLLFAGEGPMREILESDIEASQLSSRVRFLGFVEGDDLKAAYTGADIFVLPTRTHEGWGVVVQEALAAGLLVLASDNVGSATDIFATGGNEIFTANQYDLVNLLRQWLENYAWASAEGRTLRKDLASGFSSRAIATRFTEFLACQPEDQLTGALVDNV